MQFTKEEIKLASPCFNAIKTIAGERECPECKGVGAIQQGVSKWDLIRCGCKAGKVEWKWEPEVGETIHYITTSCECNIFQVISVSDTRIVILPIDIPFHHRSLDDFLYAPEIIDVIPILSWETIERILEGVGYYLKLNHYDSDLEDGVLYKGSVFVAKFDKDPKKEFTPKHEKASKSRQEAVMLAVIELGKEVKNVVS